MLKCFFFAASLLYNRSSFLIDIGQHLAPFHDRTREPVFSHPEKSQSEIGRDLAAVMVDLDESQSE